MSSEIILSTANISEILTGFVPSYKYEMAENTKDREQSSLSNCHLNINVVGCVEKSLSNGCLRKK
jgi:hypothetical protein